VRQPGSDSLAILIAALSPPIMGGQERSLVGDYGASIKTARGSLPGEVSAWVVSKT
jgi:hypothetical protein